MGGCDRAAVSALRATEIVQMLYPLGHHVGYLHFYNSSLSLFAVVQSRGFFFAARWGEDEKYDECPELSPYGIIESINANNELVSGRRREVVCTA